MSIKKSNKDVKGSIVTFGKEEFYEITNYDQIPPFFISVVSSSDHWLFISTTGGLTAGRQNSGHSIFPYYTEDKISDSVDTAGSKTIIRSMDNDSWVWEPFSCRSEYSYSYTRKLYKNMAGNKIYFVEENHDLGLAFKYGYLNSDKYGLIKVSHLENIGKSDTKVEIIDGLLNILPAGVTVQTQNEFSSLIDAYKKSEIVSEKGAAIYRMSSLLTDKAEPSESLRATMLWSVGLDNKTTYLKEAVLNSFRHGETPKYESETRGVRGTYLLGAELSVKSSESKTWYTGAEVELDKPAVKSLILEIESEENFIKNLLADVEVGTEKLVELVAKADGLQLTEDDMSSHHHFSNVLFNIMRGGLFEEGYTIDIDDFTKFLILRNNSKADSWKQLLSKLEREMELKNLHKWLEVQKDKDLIRIGMEYLPLSFSRRHGDPSRPWNIFSIDLKDDDGNRTVSYQGNWRDIFQNWEALALSWPDYLNGMRQTFLNAITADGYNPYRVTRDGFEWEEPEPDNPWSNIGYWGDHQIVYLLKLLEWEEAYHPGSVASDLNIEKFSMADIPYRLKPYAEIVKDYRDTIVFDYDHNDAIHERVEKIGADGKLLTDKNGNIRYVNLLEKLLNLFIAKMVNFVPGGGIWMNTQRPEWNDANNALVGPGISMVTLCYLRRFADFVIKIVESSNETLSLTNWTSMFMKDLYSVLESMSSDSETDAAARRVILDKLGEVGTKYRESLYSNSYDSNSAEISREAVISFFKLSLEHIDKSIKVNKRDDGLYHAYNLLDLSEEGTAEIKYLYEMLEGQVSILSSGVLTPSESADLLDKLKSSRLYREDQNSYILYPNRQLKSFMDMNTLTQSDVNSIPLLKKMSDDGDTSLISKCNDGEYVFHSSFNNSKTLEATMESLEMAVSSEDKKAILDLYEKVFDHQSFTGRSGTFFGYEGLGSIYWHMVSKLLLAVQENITLAENNGDSDAIIKSLIEHYYDVRNGIGFNKSPEVYGAFPHDPYSHTPMHTGARQPGMTGQVKEEVITRRRELGVSLKSGQYQFNPDHLRKDEFLSGARTFVYYDVDGNRKSIDLPTGSLAFTLNQVLVVYKLGSEFCVSTTDCNGNKSEVKGQMLSVDATSSLVERNGKIEQVTVDIAESCLI